MGNGRKRDNDRIKEARRKGNGLKESEEIGKKEERVIEKRQQSKVKGIKRK